MSNSLPIKIAGWSAIVLGLATIAISPRGSIGPDGVFLVSCSTKRMYLHSAGMAAEDGVKPGFYTVDTLVDAIYKKAKADYITETAGNPFAGFGLALIESIKPTFKELANSTFEEICDGTPASATTLARLTESLNSLSNFMSNNR